MVYPQLAYQCVHSINFLFSDSLDVCVFFTKMISQIMCDSLIYNICKVDCPSLVSHKPKWSLCQRLADVSFFFFPAVNCYYLGQQKKLVMLSSIFNPFAHLWTRSKAHWGAGTDSATEAFSVYLKSIEIVDLPLILAVLSPHSSQPNFHLI